MEGLFFLGFVDALCCPHFRVRVFFCGDDEKGERRNCFCDARARDSPSRPRPSACFARASGRISSQKNRGNRHYRRCQLRRPDWGNSPSEPELSFAVCLQRRPGAKEHGIYGCFLIKKGPKSGICQCRYFCVIIIFSHARFLFFVHPPGIGGTKIGRAELRPLNLGKEGETDTTHTIFGGWAEEVGRPGSNF